MKTNCTPNQYQELLYVGAKIWRILFQKKPFLNSGHRHNVWTNEKSLIIIWVEEIGWCYRLSIYLRTFLFKSDLLTR